MKILKNKNDIKIIFMTAFAILLISLSENARDCYTGITTHFPFAAGFCKFALLATTGECIAQRIIHGRYVPAGFGLLPKSIIWGLLGIATTAAFSIFYNGVPLMLAGSGLAWAPAVMGASVGAEKIFVAFMISCTMNLMFAPVLMIAHKLADMHIRACAGKAGCLLSKWNIADYLKSLDWDTMWNIVLLRSVPLFWIPAHTVVFLLPGPFRVLVAAILGAVLGLVLALAAARQHKPAPPEVLL